MFCNVLSENRRPFTPKNLEMTIVIYCNANRVSLNSVNIIIVIVIVVIIIIIIISSSSSSSSSSSNSTISDSITTTTTTTFSAVSRHSPSNYSFSTARFDSGQECEDLSSHSNNDWCVLCLTFEV
ncbi:hypothetical protein ANN_21001 [Periplaneta americana]|uniref:Uncharacterized protein n=1 Tax=Periplaneta americana TaxID=6978 RepID=A0ABQ8SFF4_PERAM|nr:hypothetical protein ANN_21001 [Periplaneta americana]